MSEASSLRHVPVKPAHDLGEIRRALALMVEPGSVVEMRCPRTAKGCVSGYYTDLEQLAKDAAYWSGRAESVYITLNPVLPDLLGRACNRVELYAKITTGDDHILRRRLLLVDFDPERPAGLSSTDAEHAAALDRARNCRDWIRSNLGWDDPLYADSGNGAHLLYRIDLPNDQASRDALSACLDVLAEALDDERVKVDPSTFNASRISKLYGTLAAKGDSVPGLGRVHRIARILEVPDSWA